MEKVIPFNFEDNQVRTVMIDNEPYFVGKDVAALLGYKNTKDALSKHVNEKDKLGSQFTTSGQNRQMTVINESGVYDLIFDASRQGKNADIRRKATEFRHWVTNDVLPSIRKEGAYVTPKTAYEWMADPNNMIKFLKKYKESQQEVQRLHDENQAMQPKADYTDKMLANPGLETTSVIAKNYGYSTREFNKLLHGLGIQYKQGKTWLLYAKYQDQGYTHVEPFPYKDSKGLEQVRNTMKWTQKGQRFLYEFLESKGIMPKVEQTA